MGYADPDEDEDEDEDSEVVSNHERGCGHIKHDASYIRLDPVALSTRGTLPMFVRCDPPIPYKESHFRGYREFPGVAFEKATSGETTTYTPLGRPSDGDDATDSQQYEIDLMRNMAHATESVENTTDVRLSDEVSRHLLRLDTDGVDAGHAGAMDVFRSPDLLMHVGKTHYQTAESFIAESRELGVNKRIPIGSRSHPPAVNPFRTRLWLIHPQAVVIGEDDDGNDIYEAGIIGYSYVTRIIHTRDQDGEVPQYIQEHADAGRLDIVSVGPEVGFDESNHAMTEYDETTANESPADD